MTNKEAINRLKQIVETQSTISDMYGVPDRYTDNDALRHAITVLQEAIDQQPKTNFEKWKQGLTLDGLPQLLNYSCLHCPLLQKCADLGFRMSASCASLIKEWGEQDADSVLV